MYDKDLIPIHWKSNIPEKCKTEAWKLFAENIIRNRWVKQFLYDRDEHKCKWCEEYLSNSDAGIIHHKSYNSFCLQPDKCIEIYDPTLNNASRINIIPDCGNCDFQRDCLDKLVLVHSKCNKEINEVQLGKKKIVSKEKESSPGRTYLSRYDNMSQEEVAKILDSKNIEFIEQYIQNRDFPLKITKENRKKIFYLCQQYYKEIMCEILCEWRGYAGFNKKIEDNCILFRYINFYNIDRDSVLYLLYDFVPILDEIDHPHRKIYVPESELDNFFKRNINARIQKGFKKVSLSDYFDMMS